ncbi:MAG TPA: HAMP domain-containing sensor histidine kinase [Bacteroidales bacterium]|nr:HAMP domain-containing sensor histidine kinase [Bacteroidales bacterium]
MKSLNLYQVKQKWKWILFFASVLIGSGSLWYTNRLVKELSLEERKKIELWADATKLIATTSQDQDLLNFLLRVTEFNTTIPVILTDSKYHVIFHRNLHFANKDSLVFLSSERDHLMATTKPIEIGLDGQGKNYLFYDESYTLKQLAIYPYVQLSVILIFIVVSYFAFSASRKAEQNKVWVGLSRETAHQLGTPTSSLMAWLELLKEKNEYNEIIFELEHDVNRLQIITERFSHIGSQPVLNVIDICVVLKAPVEYMKNRIPTSVSLSFRCITSSSVKVNVNLFNWVIENLIKNALDAVGAHGSIEISTFAEAEYVYIDVKDNGKGIPRRDFKRVFKPGFTTKSRGWGLGLSLAKRIIRNYHHGRIFVLQSELQKGTTFRIVLKQV